MFNGTYMPLSAADVAAVSRSNDNNGFGNDWWAWIILIAIFGWGWGGYGGMGGNAGNGVGAEVQRGFDTQAIVSKLDGINNGLCSLGYDQLAQMNGINTNILQTGFGLQQAINADTIANMQNTNTLSAQFSQCCCDQKMGQMELLNAMDKNNCATNNNVTQMGNAIMQNQTSGFNMLNQTIKDGFNDLEMRNMQRENADLRQRLNNCDRDSALQGTASYIINTLQPVPKPSYLTCNPNTGTWLPCGVSNPFSGCGNGCNSSGC